MSSRPANYAKLTREQVTVLKNHFENGMKSTTCSETIQKAAEETSLPVGKIKVKYFLFIIFDVLLFIFRPFDYIGCMLCCIICKTGSPNQAVCSRI